METRRRSGPQDGLGGRVTVADVQRCRWDLQRGCCCCVCVYVCEEEEAGRRRTQAAAAASDGKVRGAKQAADTSFWVKATESPEKAVLSLPCVRTHTLTHSLTHQEQSSVSAALDPHQTSGG